MPLNIDPSHVSKVLEGLYAATLDPVARSSLPNRFATAFEATSCLMHMRDKEPASITMVGMTANLQTILPAYAQTTYAEDAWSEVASARMFGRACLGEEVVPEAELLGTEWYNVLCRPANIHHIVGGVFEVEAGVNGLIGVHRPQRDSQFERSDREMMQLFLPHLAQAYRLLRMLDLGTRARTLTFDVLAALSVGVFIVSASGRVRLMNARAESFVSANSTIHICNDQISLPESRRNDHFRAAIRAAAFAPIGRSLSAGEIILVPTRNAPLSLKIVPLPPDIASFGPAEPLAAIFIGDASTGGKSSFEFARILYGLTPAEMCVLLAILNGERLSDYAQSAGISLNTVHTQLKSVFAKTGCHRQTDLLRKVLSDPILKLSGFQPSDDS